MPSQGDSSGQRSAQLGLGARWPRDWASTVCDSLLRAPLATPLLLG